MEKGTDFGSVKINGIEKKILSYVGLEDGDLTFNILRIENNQILIAKKTDQGQDSLLLTGDEIHALGFLFSTSSEMIDNHKGLEEWIGKIEDGSKEVEFFKSKNYAEN